MKSAAGIAATSASAWMGMERAAGIEYIDDAELGCADDRSHLKVNDRVVEINGTQVTTFETLDQVKHFVREQPLLELRIEFVYSLLQLSIFRLLCLQLRFERGLRLPIRVRFCRCC